MEIKNNPYDNAIKEVKEVIDLRITKEGRGDPNKLLGHDLTKYCWLDFMSFITKDLWAWKIDGGKITLSTMTSIKRCFTRVAAMAICGIAWCEEYVKVRSQ